MTSRFTRFAMGAFGALLLTGTAYAQSYVPPLNVNGQTVAPAAVNLGTGLECFGTGSTSTTVCEGSVSGVLTFTNGSGTSLASLDQSGNLVAAASVNTPQIGMAVGTPALSFASNGTMTANHSITLASGIGFTMISGTMSLTGTVNSAAAFNETGLGTFSNGLVVNVIGATAGIPLITFATTTPGVTFNYTTAFSGAETHAGTETHTGTDTFSGSIINAVAAKTAAYTVGATDCGNTVTVNATTAITVTVPVLTVGCKVAVSELGTGIVTLTNATGEQLGTFNSSTSTSTTSTTTAGNASVALGGANDSRVIKQVSSTLALVSAGQ